MSMTEQIFESKKTLWASYILAAIPVLLLLMSGVMKVMQLPMATEGFVHLGYPEHVALPIGIVELLCIVLYVIPRISVVGAILLTGYLGGATATHVRVSEPFHMAMLLGVVLWGSLYLRDARLRALIPLRS